MLEKSFSSFISKQQTKQNKTKNNNYKQNKTKTKQNISELNFFEEKSKINFGPYFTEIANLNKLGNYYIILTLVILLVGLCMKNGDP